MKLGKKTRGSIRQNKQDEKKTNGEVNGSDYIDKDAQSVTSSLGETNDSVASSPSGPISEIADLTNTSADLKSSEQSFQTKLVPPSDKNPLETVDSMKKHSVHNNPIKRQQSQGSTLFKSISQGNSYKTKLPDKEENGESNNTNNELSSSFASNEENGDSVANDDDCDDDDEEDNDDDDDDDDDEEEDEENDDDQGSGRASEDPTAFEGEESNMAPSTVSEESATIRYRLGMGMVSDEEDSRDFDSENGNLTGPVTDLTGVTGDSTACHLTGEGFTELSGPPGSEMTDVSALLQNTSGRKHGHNGSTQQEENYDDAAPPHKRTRTGPLSSSSLQTS